MKYLPLFLILLSFQAYGSIQKEYVLKYTFNNQKLEIHQKAASYLEALELASQSCYNFYKEGTVFNEQQRLDIIDVCANPRK